MKIIFDSEEQKMEFVGGLCVRDFMDCYTPCSAIYHSCTECWKNSGVEMEVKEDEK